MFTTAQYYELFSGLDVLHHCRCCPRECGADRFSTALGYCKSGAGFHISSICRHRGEEPVISGEHGICNVFFAHCNLQCLYCQNYQISCNSSQCPTYTLEAAIEEIIALLDGGCRAVGFVSPSHMVPQVKVIVRALNMLGRRPVIVYNSNGYDKLEELRLLEGLVDVYLPDLKYLDPSLSLEYSGSLDYPEVARAALKEMYRQKGNSLVVNDQGIAVFGMLVRHLVLPGHVENSKQALRFIASEMSLGTHVSLMSQYYPTAGVSGLSTLGARLPENEYLEAVSEMERLGLRNGWLQDMKSHGNYRPDFSLGHPFER